MSIDTASGPARGSRAVASGILASRVAGLVRERVIAHHLGGGLGAEAFRAALRIPNLLQNLLGEGVISAAFVPTYARLVHEGRDEDAGRLAGAVASLLVLVTGLLVLIGTLAARPLTRILAPGFVPGTPRFDLTVTLVRIVTPGLGLLVLAAWSLGVLTAHRRFFLPYVAPVLWNAAIIVAVTVVALDGADEVTRTQALAWGATIGAGLQFAVQVPTVLRLAGRLRSRPSRSTPGLVQVLRASAGALLGRGVVQLSAYLDLVLASLAAAGAVAALGYAQVLYLLPVSLFGMSVAAATLPELAITARRDPERASASLAAALARTAFLVVPTAAAYLVLGDHLVGTLYRTGRFDADLGRQVALVLSAYAIGMAATTSSRILQTALYGADDTVTPARVAALRVVVSAAVGTVLMVVLDAWAVGADGIARVAALGIADESARSAASSLLRLGGVGLALGASVGGWVELVVLHRRVVRRLGRPLGVAPALRRIVVATAAAVPAGLLGRGAVRLLELGPLTAGPVALLPAAVVYLVVADRLGVPEARALVIALSRRIARSTTRLD